MSERAITIPYARGKDENRYTARQMSKELYAYKLRWKGFFCPVDGCNRHLKWTSCAVRGKFWSHKQLNGKESEMSLAQHSGETWSHITAKAKVVDNLGSICFRAKKCHCCNKFESYSFNGPTNSAKTEHLVMKGIRADVAVFEKDKLIAVISIVKSHKREPEKWQKIYDELGVMVFEVPADDVLGDDYECVYSDIYVHWGMCKECLVLWEEIKALRDKEPQFVVEDGRHLSELKNNELSILRHSEKAMKPKAEELLRERGVCFRCCKRCSGEDFCAPCKKFLTSTNCAHCGTKTMTTWRVHCVACCKIINSTKCKVCQKPTHSDWKQYCYDCHEDEKEKKRKREEEERQEEEQRRRREQKRRREEQERKWEKERQEREKEYKAISARNQAKRMSKQHSDNNLEKRLEEQAKQRQKLKAQKKRREEKELKVYKETNTGYQKKINDNREDFGLPKNKVQKTMSSFFRK